MWRTVGLEGGRLWLLGERQIFYRNKIYNHHVTLGSDLIQINLMIVRLVYA